jgi:hypothetical protein
MMPGWHEASMLARAAVLIAGFWLVYLALTWAVIWMSGVL